LGKLSTIEVHRKTKKILLEERHQKVVSEWEYMAFLQLLDTKDFRNDDNWIARRLQLSRDRLREVINNLVDLKFLVINDRKSYRRTVDPIETTEDFPDDAVKQSHRESLHKSLEALEKVPVSKRDFSSITFAIDPDKIPEAKGLIREFQDKLYEFMSTQKNNTEVYKFNCQLFSLTQPVTPERFPDV
jgi:uncharacterized protein (TIGR02147 family)